MNVKPQYEKPRLANLGSIARQTFGVNGDVCIVEFCGGSPDGQGYEPQPS